MTCFVFLYAAFFRQGGYKEVEFQTSIIGFAQLSQFRMLVISARFPGAEQGPPYFSLLCNVPPHLRLSFHPFYNVFCVPFVVAC